MDLDPTSVAERDALEVVDPAVGSVELDAELEAIGTPVRPSEKGSIDDALDKASAVSAREADEASAPAVRLSRREDMGACICRCRRGHRGRRRGLRLGRGEDRDRDKHRGECHDEWAADYDR